MSNDTYKDMINSKIEQMRPKLLDLTRRNPLLSTKFSTRRHSLVRVIDELPDNLFDRLQNKQMRFDPLPQLDQDPKDEQNSKFKKALVEAKISDDIYQDGIESLDYDSEDFEEQEQQLIRELKDRVRECLSMPPRVTKKDLSLEQHARINFIDPSHELPFPSDDSISDKHTDNFIQTLLLPDMLERKMNSLLNKQREYEQETGLDVLKAVFGFLEWKEANSSKKSYAPIILLPIKIERKKTPKGLRFYVKAEAGAAEINLILIEKLKQDFGIEIEIPYIEDMSLEEYFEIFAGLLPDDKKWMIRRQVAFGVFPSANMAIYEDINTENWDFDVDSPVGRLLAGGNPSGSEKIFADDYEVDRPEIEKKVPLIVTSADSSQFSLIADVMDGRNIAVEGPPGSGKSQTIVNIIAAALADGKKVLFVAEKMAALEVVRNRLKACGLSDLLLTLQAKRSSRKQVIDSLRDRIEAKSKRCSNFDESIKKYKDIREKLKKYIDILSSEFGSTNKTVHEVLGKSIALNELCKEIPSEILNKKVDGIKALTDVQVSIHVEKYSSLVQYMTEVKGKNDFWEIARLASLDRFTIDDTIALVKECIAGYESVSMIRKKLPEIGLLAGSEILTLEEIKNCDISKNESLVRTKKEQIERAITIGTDRLLDFYKVLININKEINALSALLYDPVNAETAGKLNSLAGFIVQQNIESLQEIDISNRINSVRAILDGLGRWDDIFGLFQSNCGSVAEVNVFSIVEAVRIIREYSLSIFTLRSDVFNDYAVREALPIIKETAKDLCNKKLELEKVFHLPEKNDGIKANEHVATLTRGGLFSFLRKDYKSAKNYYLSITKKRKFKKISAIDDIRDLVKWQHECESFISQKIKPNGLESYCNNGIESDFESLYKIAQLYDEVEANLSAPTDSKVKEFLKNGDIEELAKISRLEDAGAKCFDLVSNTLKINDLDAMVQEKKNQLGVLNSIVSLSGLFCDRNTVTLDLLKQLHSRVTALHGNIIQADKNIAAKEILGDLFQGSKTSLKSRDFVSVINALELIKNSSSAAQKCLVAVIGDSDSLLHADHLVDEILIAEQKAEESINKLALQLNVSVSTIKQKCRQGDYSGTLRLAVEDVDGLKIYSRINSIIEELEQEGFGQFCEHANRIEDLQKIPGMFEAYIVHRKAKVIFNDPETGHVLANKFTGERLDSLRKEFVTLDKKLEELNRRKLLRQSFENAILPAGNNLGRKREWTDMALVCNEIGKKRAYIPVRDLTKRAGSAILELKPCWMMPPLAVAQYLPKDELFDLVIVDEASQMKPENAISALARAKQAVIVGDTNQLPPSSFFQKLLDTPDDDEEQEFDNVTEESVLELANSMFRPARRLRWHYRSQHSSLIQFSNIHVYDSHLQIFPSANENRKDMGVSYKKVEGYYAKGLNPEEAKAMVEAIVDFMEKHDERSLGVVVLNQKQKDYIQELIDLEIANNSIVSKYIEKWDTENDGLESFFVKNLENVQGDERDVIFIGTVYGPAGHGMPVMQRFGPVNNIAGKRRLNVLFTRAKKQIITFSSMTESDIQASEGDNEGRYLLKKWLEYSAAKGKRGLDAPTNRGTDSPFEDYVIDQLKAIGCEAQPQVGVSGYFIDIGVKHPKWPHGFIMGVECDGAAYHSAKSARDRDKIREEVLTKLGWYLHRIWSTDWFDDPQRESRRLRQVIEMRIKELEKEYSESEKTIVSTSQPEPITSNNVTEDIKLTQTKQHSSDHFELTRTSVTRSLFDDDKKEEPEKLPDPKTAKPHILSEKLTEVVSEHGPMLAEYAYKIYITRVGYRKLGSSFREILENAMKRAIRAGMIVEVPHLFKSVEIIKTPEQNDVIVRTDDTDRDFYMIPHNEIALLAERLKKENSTDNESWYRAILESYGIVRFTQKVEEHLNTILS